MKSNIKKILILLGFVFIAAFLIGNTSNSNEELPQDTEKTELKISGAWVMNNITIDDTGGTYGAYTWDQAKDEAWCTLQNGIYIIENVTIDASISPTGNGILINNSNDENFIIRNCTIYDAVASMFLWDNNGGIRLINSSKGQIYSNDLTSTTGAITYKSGICLYESKDVSIINNTCNGNTYGIFMRNSNETLIFNNSASSNRHTGIFLQENCHYNNITQNSASSNWEYHGIAIYSDSYNNNIINNTANENDNAGIYLLTNCNFNNITGNTVNNNYWGIYLDDCNFNNITGNTANDNDETGIHFEAYCDNNIILGNNVNEISGIGYDQAYGIYFYEDCDFNNITGNTANDNVRWGIYLWDYSDFNNITGNTANNNGEYGIYLENCDNNTISGNTANDNGDSGIYLDESHWNNITDNFINHNGIYGIYLSSSNYNNISNNEFIGNQICWFEDTCVGNIFSNNDCNKRPELTNGAVDPKSGDQYTQFTFTVNYTDQENDGPSYIYVVINGTAYAMVKQYGSDSDYTDGCIYNRTITLAPGAHNYTYYFECSDGYGFNTTSTYNDLEVINIAPVLTMGSLDPKIGDQYTQFTFTINYTDQNNDTPSYINVVINGTTYAMVKQDGSDFDYTDGCIYNWTISLAPAAYNYTYYFECSDGYDTNTTSTHSDLEVYRTIVPVSGDDDDDDDDKKEEEPDFTGVIIAVIVIGGIVGALAILYFVKPELVKSFAEKLKKERK